MARSSEAKGVYATGPMAAGHMAAGPLAVGLVPSSVPARSHFAAPGRAGAAAGGAETSGEPISDAVYLGTVKSYNDRRGFGFIACPDTLAAYGRDVYMAKAEVQNSGSHDASHRGGKHMPDIHSAMRIAEEDSVLFQVRLSVEGYPQAANVQRLRKFRGVVLHPPPEDSEDVDEMGTVVSEELVRAFGDREAALRREDCGQVRLASGDEVTFCVPMPVRARGSESVTPEAKQVVLHKTNRYTRTILGCFSLRLPRPRVGYHQRVQRKDLRVDCHAFNDRIIIAGLPGDCDEAELRRFFSKQGASDTIATRARGCGFASVSFPSMAEVAKFLSRAAHAFTDDKETQIATLHGRRICAHPHADTPRLPALPAPTLMPGEFTGTLLVSWSPLVLAVGYSVEIRPAGVRAAWQGVDGATGGLKAGGAGRFDKDRSSCKVTGLDATSAYEARVTYFTSCGCKAEASDVSERCIPCPGARMPLGQPGLPLGLGAGGLAVPAVFGSCWPGAAAATGLPPMHVQASVQPPLPMGFPSGQPNGLLAGMHQALFPNSVAQQQPSLAGLVPPPAASVLAGAEAGTGWRCAHGAVIPPPPVPEVHPADDYGFAVSVQWPSVSHAAAYVVELREQSSSSVERFMRSAPMATRGSIVELRVGGLRPSGPPGQRYAAQVRCIADCGCESAPSAPGWSPTVGASQQPPQPATQVAQGSPTMLPAMAPAMAPPAMLDTAAPSPPGAMAMVTPTLLPSTPEPQHLQQQAGPPPQAFMAALGMPSWISAMTSQAGVQPTAVALYSQVVDPSPTAASDAGGASAAAAALAAAAAAGTCPADLGGLATAAPQAPQGANLVQADGEVPPELTGCEECLLLD
mmetsp:Transcript_49569/g.153008  ORF Transcript_49569/g.153008 Transcript_49569/m.153008 type:complete len:859 (+) Transcript_49569:47-2623(+)